MTRYRTQLFMLAGTSCLALSSAAVAQNTGAPLTVPEQEDQATQSPPADPTVQSVPAPATAEGVTPGPSGGDIVVTAQRRGERLRDVPISVDVETAKTLQAANIATLREIAQVSPGVTFTQNGPYAQPTIRGQSVDAATIGNESNVAIYVDGVYQPVQQANFFELADVSRIEILKGPQGTLFGRNASAGAIQIITRDPSLSGLEGSVAATGGLFSTRGGEFGAKGFVSTPLSENLAISLSGLYSHTEGYYKNVVTDKRVGDIDSRLIRGKLLFKPTDWLRLTPSAYWYKRKDESVYQLRALSPYPASEIGPHPEKPYEVGINESAVAKLESWGASLRAEADVLRGTLTSTTAYTNIKSDLLADGDATSLPILAYLLVTPNKSFQQELIYASPQLGPVKFVAGAFYFDSKDKYDPLQVGPTADSPFQYAVIYARTTTKAWAGFGEANVNITDRLVATGGLRYSSERRTYDGGFGTPNLTRIGAKRFTAWTPRASLRYALSPTSNVYVSYSQGFKSGLFDATSFSPIPYEPEKTKAYELGVKTKIGRQVELTAAIFQNDTKNRQVVANGPNGLPIISNAASQRIRGGELSVDWRSGTGFGLNAGLSYLPKAEYLSYPNAVVQAPDFVNGGAINLPVDLSGTRVQKTPKLQASLLGFYETDLSWGKVGGSGNIAYTSKFFYAIGGFVPQKAYALINASLYWSPPSEKFRVTAFVKNLTNETVIQNFVNLSVAYQPPRQFGLTGEVRF